MNRERYYEATVWPSGEYEVRLIDTLDGRTRLVLRARALPEAAAVLGLSLQDYGERMARCAIADAKREAAKRASEAAQVRTVRVPA